MKYKYYQVYPSSFSIGVCKICDKNNLLQTEECKRTARWTTDIKDIIYKTQNGEMCGECIEIFEEEDADFACGFGVWGDPT